MKKLLDAQIKSQFPLLDNRFKIFKNELFFLNIVKHR